MDLDAMLYDIFGTTDIDSVDPQALAEGRGRIAVAFGTESDPGRRFALWVLLHGLGDAPDPEQAFAEPGERAAAQAYARAIARAEEG